MSNRNPSRKLPNSSRLCLTSSNSNQDSVDPVETFSKYFAKSKLETVSESSAIESPYQNSCGSKIEKLYTSLDDEKDFRSPLCVKRYHENARAASKQGRKRNVPKDKRKTTQMVLTKSSNQNCDVNPDHLQLAVALSKSLQDTDGNRHQIKKCKEKPLSLKEMLAQFGFRTNTDRKETFKAPEKKKKRRFQYITPVLYLRTEEDRQKIISKKVAEILSKENTVSAPRPIQEFIPLSSKIKKLWDPDCEVYSVNARLNTLTEEDFYVRSLNFTPCKTRCGCLLRNWSEIPGREPSPQPVMDPKEQNIEDEQMSIEKSATENKIPRVMSPELFASDDEKTPEKPKEAIVISSDEECSESLLSSKIKSSPKKLNVSLQEDNILDRSKSSELSGFDVLENENGICTYESFACEKVDFTCQLAGNDICELMRSSDEDGLVLQSFNEKHNTIQVENADKVWNRNSTSLDVADYVHDFLNYTVLGNRDEKVLHLTQSSSSLDLPNVDEATEEVKEANASQSSQESVCINDEELNYSSIHAKDTSVFTYKTQSPSNFDCDHLNQTGTFNQNAQLLKDPVNVVSHTLASESVPEPAPSTSKASTPKNEVIVKTTDVTPVQNYSDMDTPKIAKELEKYGLKPLKRRRGVQLLKHIYESTHPIIDGEEQQSESDENAKGRTIKKRKINKEIDFQQRISQEAQENLEIVGDLLDRNGTMEDLFFERKQSKRVNSCRVPLHIAWHNLLSSQPQLKKSILLYEPIQLEILHIMLKDQGYNYHIQDLLTFLDRKCITIRTNQSNR